MNGNAPLPIVIFEQQWIVFVDPGTPFTCPRRALHKRVLVGYENEISEGSIETIKGARTALSKWPEKPDHIRDPPRASVFANPAQFATICPCGEL
jgi:hypothetical protein